MPVRIRSPGSSVMNWLMYDTTVGTPKMKLRVLLFCTRWPLTSSHRSMACGSGTSSAMASQGPMGAKVS
ncbi:hypothetical protein D3C71_1912100 [compost metagenome]